MRFMVLADARHSHQAWVSALGRVLRGAARFLEGRIFLFCLGKLPVWLLSANGGRAIGCLHPASGSRLLHHHQIIGAVMPNAEMPVRTRTLPQRFTSSPACSKLGRAQGTRSSRSNSGVIRATSGSPSVTTCQYVCSRAGLPGCGCRLINSAQPPALARGHSSRARKRLLPTISLPSCGNFVQG